MRLVYLMFGERSISWLPRVCSPELLQPSFYTLKALSRISKPLILGFVFRVSILHQSCFSYLVIGPFSPFVKPVRKIVETCTHLRYTLVHLARFGSHLTSLPPVSPFEVVFHLCCLACLLFRLLSSVLWFLCWAYRLILTFHFTPFSPGSGRGSSKMMLPCLRPFLVFSCCYRTCRRVVQPVLLTTAPDWAWSRRRVR